MVIVIRDDVDVVQLVLQVPQNMNQWDAERSVNSIIAVLKTNHANNWCYSDVCNNLESRGFLRLVFTEWSE